MDDHVTLFSHNDKPFVEVGGISIETTTMMSTKNE